ncbi:MAG: glycosyltransferase [Bacilli bacterium]
MKKVSIIVPVYNKEKELDECLTSLVNQTLSDIEIIVIDDASTDNSKNIILSFQKKYPNLITGIYNKVNQGIGKTRNIGIEVATGEYLGFVDADDYVKLNMYNEYYDFAKQNKLDIVTGHYDKIGKTDIPFYTNKFPSCNVKTNPKLVFLIDYGPCTKIFKHELVVKSKALFDEKLKYEDMPFVAKTVSYARKVGHIDQCLYCYRIHDNSETTVVDKRVYDMFKIMKIVNNSYKDYDAALELEALNILQITMYMLQQRNQKNSKIRNDFIDKGYKYLNDYNPKWRTNKYYKEQSCLKRIVKNNKFILKIYCIIF